MSQVVSCPSGLSGRVRGMKVREERILADRKLAKDGGQLDELLKACWEETVDPGPYSFAGNAVDWSSVLQGDRFYMLMQIRAQTYGAEYSFSCGCSNCRSRFEWELDLNALPVRRLSDSSLAAFVAGNRFESALPDSGKRIYWRLPVGADEAKLVQLRKNGGERLLSAMLNWRVDEVEGIQGKEKRAFLEELSMRDADYLMGEFEAADCGVETRIEVECPHCFGVQEIELPFEQGFFLPGAKRKRAASSQK